MFVPRLDMAALLVAVAGAPPVAAADVVGVRLASDLGASDVSFLIADFSGRALTRLVHTHTATSEPRRYGTRRAHDHELAESVPFAGTVHGQVLASQTIDVELADGEFRVLAPVSNRGEAIGLLELSLSESPDDATFADVALAAQVLAYVVIANRRFTDLYTWGQRSVPLTLAAEIQHRLLPGAYTCEAGPFTLAAWLEPSGNVGGDTFDFSLERDTLHLSITDAMGHALDSAVLATVFVGALRNARRANVSLEQQVDLANRSLRSHTRGHAFVTGQVVRIDLTTGAARIVNAGHPRPFRLRGGLVQEVPLVADPPFGILERQVYDAQELSLEAGDRLLFFTDGMIERDAVNFDLASLVEDSAHMHPREAVQHVVQGFLGAVGGELTDDATAMCVDWHGRGVPA
jgi:hypothetical protein